MEPVETNDERPISLESTLDDCYSPADWFALERFYEHHLYSFEETTKGFYDAHALPNDSKRPRSNDDNDNEDVEMEEGSIVQQNKRTRLYCDEEV